MCCSVVVVAVKKRLYKKSKINSIFIYKYRSIFRVWERLHENCNTATASAESELASAMPSARSLDEVNTATKMRHFDQKKKSKKFCKHS